MVLVIQRQMTVGQRGFSDFEMLKSRNLKF
jgi:hypothetical protein